MGLRWWKKLYDYVVLFSKLCGFVGAIICYL